MRRNKTLAGPPAVPLPADGSIRPLTRSEFAGIQRLAREKFGLDLRTGKESLVSGRLAKKLREGGHRSFDEYLETVTRDASGTAMIEMIDLLTTNHTSFLRERQHFEFLGEILPGYRRRPKLELWCAACSSGEEAYTLACVLAEAARTGGIGHDFQVLATDISTRALEKAKRGVYPADRANALPEPWRKEYFLRGKSVPEGVCQVAPALAGRVSFRRLNLIELYSHARPFPLIFCRNAMIYFDKPTQSKVVAAMTRWLEPGGYLFIGHAESLSGIDHGLQYVRPAVYRKPGGEEQGEPSGIARRGRA
jgi:chemotaxis protein methyltransferase CheR